MPNRRPAQLPVELFPPEVVTEGGAPDQVTGRLHPEEAVFVARAVPKRRREFRAGRLYARAALERLGVVDFPLLMNDDRQPVWPPGIVGSISHADGICGVAAARRDRIRGIGLDIEVAGAVSNDVQAAVLNEHERAWVERQSESTRSAALIFSAKEAVYKGLCSIRPLHLEFGDLHITAEPCSGQFEAVLAGTSDAPAGIRFPLTGGYRFDGPWVFTGIAIQ